MHQRELHGAMSTNEINDRLAPRSGSGQRPMRRDLMATIAVVTLLVAASSPSVAQAQGSPSPDPAILRPILAAPLPMPATPPPLIDPDGPPSASVERHGVRLDLWVPAEPVPSGAWTSTLLRVTNVGEVPVWVPGYPDNLPCQLPIQGGVDLRDLWAPGVEWSGNAGIFKAAALGAGSSASAGTEIAGRDRDGTCLDVGLPAGRLRPGASFDVTFQTWVRYPWRDQHLPTGTASEGYRLTFYRSNHGEGREGRRTFVEVRAPLAIAGTDVTYPSPQSLIDTALGQPEFLAWIETRDFGQDWSGYVEGIEPPRGMTFAEVAPLAGPAPEDTVEIRAFAEGSAPGTYGNVTIDPWDASVVEVVIR
jgi:hypothetical protein